MGSLLKKMSRQLKENYKNQPAVKLIYDVWFEDYSEILEYREVEVRINKMDLNKVKADPVKEIIRNSYSGMRSVYRYNLVSEEEVV